MTPEILNIIANMSAGAFALVVLTWVVGRLLDLIQYAWKAPEQPSATNEPNDVGHDGFDI